MSKEKKDMLKAILANTELIMTHLNIKSAAKTSSNNMKPAAKKLPVKTAAPKKAAVKKK